MTQDERTACMVELYGEVCKKADAARILHSTAPTIRAMLADGRLDSACGGEMVDVRSIARYICNRKAEDFRARTERAREKRGCKYSV